MKRRSSITVPAGILALIFTGIVFTAPLFAEDAEPPAGGDEAAMMEAWMKIASPGEHHAHMAKTVGDWDFTGKFWMTPGSPATESKGTAKIESILGGRYFKTTIHGDFMGMPFQGLGIDGYDNGKQKHIGAWFDSMGTMMLTSEGTCRDDGRITTTWSEYLDPMSGTTNKMKNVITVQSENHMTYESYELDDQGGKRKTMEISYHR